MLTSVIFDLKQNPCEQFNETYSQPGVDLYAVLREGRVFLLVYAPDGTLLASVGADVDASHVRHDTNDAARLALHHDRVNWTSTRLTVLSL